MISTTGLAHPDVSVVIPARNRQQLVPRAIASALAQDFNGELEVIVVDDASSDDTAQVVADYPDSRVRLIRRYESRGGGTARNDGIQAARAPVIAFLDSDDTWMEHKLSEQLSVLANAANPQKTVVYSRCSADFGSQRVFIRPRRAISQVESVGDYLFLNNGLMITTTLLAPKDLLRSVMFTDDLPKHQDWDLCLRLEAAGAEFVMATNSLAIWHRDPRDERITRTVVPGASKKWLETVKPYLSHKAYLAKRAEFCTRDPEATRREAIMSVRTALIRRALSPTAAALFVLEAVAPKLRTTLRTIVGKAGLLAPSDVPAIRRRRVKQ